MAIIEKNTITPDNLFAGPEIPVLTKNYTLTPGAALKRGTLLTVTRKALPVLPPKPVWPPPSWLMTWTKRPPPAPPT